MDSDRHSKSKRDDRKKDRKRKSRSRSSNSRSRSSSSDSPYSRKRKSKKSNYESSEKYSSRQRDPRDEMSTEEEYRRNMMGFPPFPMMFDQKMKMGYDMNPMMPMQGMQRVYHPMPGYAPPMMRPQMYPPPMIPPMSAQMDPMMSKMGRMTMKHFQDPKAVLPVVKKDKEKSTKKDEDSGKVLEFPTNLSTAETFRSLHLSVKNLQEPLFLVTCKKILSDLEGKLREKKLKSRAKEIAEFVSNLSDKIREAEKKEKKGGSTSTRETQKISELELINALNEIDDIKTFLSLVNLEKFPLDNCFDANTIHVTESEESVALFEEAKSLFESSKNVTV